MKNNELNNNENRNKISKTNKSEIDNGSLNIIREYGKGKISLRDTLEDSVAMITRYYGKQNKFRIDKEIDK